MWAACERECTQQWVYIFKEIGLFSTYKVCLWWHTKKKTLPWDEKARWLCLSQVTNSNQVPSGICIYLERSRMWTAVVQWFIWMILLQFLTQSFLFVPCDLTSCTCWTQGVARTNFPPWEPYTHSRAGSEITSAHACVRWAFSFPR